MLNCFSHVWLSATPGNCGVLGSSVHGILQARTITGLACHLLLWGDLPDQRIEPSPLMSSALAGDFFTTSAPWEALRNHLFPVASGQYKAGHGGWASHLYHFSGGSDGKKKSTCNAADPGLTPGSGWSFGEGNGNPLQYSCLENSLDPWAWQAIVYEVAKNRTQLSH